MAGGFKEFVLRGNVVDLAVGVVVGAAFGAVVTEFTKDLLTPLIAALVGKPDFSAIQFEVNGSKFLIGNFLNAIIAFLLVATAVYYWMADVRVNGFLHGSPKTMAAAMAGLFGGGLVAVAALIVLLRVGSRREGRKLE